jgi:hypothetical protein
MSNPRDHSEEQKAAAREIRESLRDLERTAEVEHLDMLGYLLRIAIVEADQIIGHAETATNTRPGDLGNRK